MALTRISKRHFIYRDEAGRIVFFPVGVSGCGRVLPDESTRERIEASLDRLRSGRDTIVSLVGLVALPGPSVSWRLARGLGVEAFKRPVPGEVPLQWVLYAGSITVALLIQLAVWFPRVRRLARLIARIADAPEIPTVGRLEQLSGYTARTLERRFHEELGVTPKQYLRSLRFERARRLLRAGRSTADVAAEAGYADQAHLSHEFRRFAGLSPTELARESE